MGTPAPQGKVAVIGGSIAGCAAAIAAHKAGFEVALFERSRNDLAERGFGICLPEPLLRECVEAGYLDAAMPVWDIFDRHWFTRETDGTQRHLWTSPARMVAFNWGLLWKSLRSQVPDSVYRLGRQVTDVREEASGGAVVVVDGQEERFDLVVGADGYKSIVRGHVVPDATPSYAGYVTWRGVIDAADLPNLESVLSQLESSAATAGFDGGHVMFYPIPGPDGRRRINWLVYTRPPESVDVGLSMSYASDSVKAQLTPAFQRLIEEKVPEEWGRIVLRTPDSVRAFQPIFDLELERCASAPFVLAGDASTVTRPHTASGGTKALQDALCLERVLRESGSVAEAVTAYNDQRNDAGNDIVKLGRRLGSSQVLETPDWYHMNAERMSDWVAATLAGQSVYIYAQQSKS
ncbi:2-polyprenyl-6-methoxyphenol hydroxylase-like FAD-dependent oxidoreductase [Stackebrandtia endophytica]|uniref:2-polyprenyl-6-methoxyphenol hydroxylase-like FAD-dependent oxidoreductase n=1 Tax=Stackebrandtia endophytica TaxID=1496996 RepID=A0A543AWB6_9ACTN|nr:FAD-dependent monooxygenase [Stackebrandtia endophytica]TQL76844.1 2-polyprenyl-6-methoxyphenol hydroxylase-like FAD-dependent oxidoreductase [Stackebrandtia endophytica]